MLHDPSSYHIRPYPLENTGSRPLSHRQANEGRSSSWVGDDQRMPGVVCFCCSFVKIQLVMEQRAHIRNPSKFALFGQSTCPNPIGPQSGRHEPMEPMLRVIGKSRTCHSSGACPRESNCNCSARSSSWVVPSSSLPSSLRTDLPPPRDLFSPVRHMSKHALNTGGPMTPPCSPTRSPAQQLSAPIPVATPCQ
jgi:hypothetical protein